MTRWSHRKRQRGEAKRGSLSVGLSLGAASFIGTTLVALITSVFIARLYGVKVVGQFALVWAPVAAVALLSTVREQPALQREVSVLPPRHPRVSGLFMAVFAFSSGLTVVISLIGAGIMWVVFHGPIHHPDLFVPTVVNLAGYTLFTNTCMNYDSIFIAFRDGRQLFYLRMHQAVLYLALVIGGRVVSGSVWSLVATANISWAFPCVHRLIASRKWLTYRLPRAEIRDGFRALPEMLRFGLKLTPTGLLWGACDQIATWVLGSITTLAVVGAYNRAWTLSQRFIEARSRLSELLFPTLVERRVKGDKEGFDRALIDSLRYSTAFLLVFAAVGGGASSGIMAVFGKGFTNASTALTFLLLVPAFTTMVFIVSQALIANDRALALSITAVVRLVVTFPAVIVLTDQFGVTGAALGMAIGAAAQIVCQFLFVQREVLGLFPHWWPARQLLGQLVAYAAGFLSARLTLLAVPGYFGLMIALLDGIVGYGVALVFVGGLLARDRQRFEVVTRRVVGMVASRRRRAPAPGGLTVEPLTLPLPPLVGSEPGEITPSRGMG